MPASALESASLISGRKPRQIESATVGTGSTGTKKLRAACDACHNAKIKCSGGGVMCAKCIKDKVQCRYSYRGNIGKPKGSLNKKTLERMSKAAQRPAHVISPISPVSQDRVPLPGTPTASTHDIASLRSANEGLSAFTTNYVGQMDVEQDDVDIFGQFDLAEMPLFGSMESDSQSLGIDALQPTFSSADVLPTPPSLQLDLATHEPSNENDDESDDDGLDDGEGKLEIFELLANIFTEPYRGSPASSRSRRNDSHHQLIDHNPIFARQSHAPVFSAAPTTRSSIQCGCFQTLSELLCQVRSLGANDFPVELDVVLSQCQPMLAAISRFLQCSFCCSDPQVFLQATMILQTVFQHYESLIHPSGISCQQLDIRIGNYNVPHGTGSTVKMLIVTVEMGHAKKLLDALKRRVEMLPARGLQTEFLKGQTQSLIQALQGMAEKLRIPNFSSLEQ
ncbi:hypothetical protein BDV95DRAFT_608465 [Massariosphaeria phaeospora]|uniref:Zn(2)-C6 fungal-type domain-containing protein n=1 Tax=Massariosphaeria phaeospora TaxID=100035 RepID=A0A7C8MHJ4_9PLEO|nr:hypothetical protein BDV95DRAFT_608465 [Massariosphaeria phaeospora]